jgi:peptidoglycan/LPS O-acetylase OafA/YrhL
MKYRTEIDGLRALAVLPVILFHAGLEKFSGGFVGVDVFFVISGYLITTIIISELAEGKFSIVNFYERRARRILPALFFVMLVCLPFAWMWLTPNDLKDFGKSLVAVSTFSSNISFWSESNYFDTTVELKPLIHTWSLAVEEQYYILFPVFLLLTWRLGIKSVLILLAIVFVTSLGAAHWGAFNKPGATFYWLPTRGWELLIGVFAAFYLKHKDYLKSYIANQILSLIGLGMIAYSIFAFDESTPFPSFYALIPTVGTVLLILSAIPNTLAHKILSFSPIVRVGLISYSTYLWHQPILAFARHRLIGELSDLLLLILCLTSFAMAYISWRWVEKPFRDKKRTTRKMIFSFSLIGIVFFSVVGLYFHFYKGMNRFANNVESIPTILDQKCHFSEDTMNLSLIEQDIFCKLGNDKIQPDTFLIGDSHAGSISDQLGTLFLSQNRSLLSFSGPYCSPAIGFHLENFGKNCVEQTKKVINYAVSNEGIKNVIIYAQWSNYTKGYRENDKPQLGCYFNQCSDNIDDNSSIFQNAFNETISLLTNSNKKIYILYPSPEFRYKGDRVYYRNQLFGKDSLSNTSIDEYEKRNTEILKILKSIKSNRITFIDTKDIFCSSNLCNQLGKNGFPLFFDTNHVNNLGAELIINRLEMRGL